MKKILLTGTVLGGLLLPHAAFAQDAAEQEEAQSTRGLNTITVTAQRREETLQDAAIPINAATGAELTQAGVVDATALGKVAPALYVTSGGGANAGYFIRGVGNFTNNGYTSPAVAFNLDGVYIGRPSSTISSFLDLNRVEVLKGPQGTLYGRNSTGGAINVIPNTPRLGELSGSISGLIGNYNAVQGTAVLNAPIGDNAAVRLAGTINQRDGYNEDGTNDADDMAFRAQIYAELGENIDIRIAGDYSTQKGIGPGTSVLGNYTFAPPFVPGRNDLPVPGWAFNPAPANVAAPHTGLHTGPSSIFLQGVAGAPLHSPFSGFVYPSRDDEYWGINAEINFDLGGVDLTVIPAYRKSTLDNQFNGPPFKAAINQDTAEQFSVEARLSGEAGPLDWLLGGYYFDEQVVGKNSFNQFSTVAHNEFDSRSESLAAFARATFNVTDDLRLVGGVRYTDESRSIDAFATATAGVCFFTPPFGGPPNCSHLPTMPVGLTLAETLGQLDPALFPGGPAPFLMADPANNFDPNGPNGVGQAFTFGPLLGGGPAGIGALLSITPNTTQRKGGDSEFTFRAAVEYDVTPDSLLYASFENGFRAGGFNLSFGNEEYDPEFIDAFTIGSKNRFFDDLLELNIEAFYWKYSGQQLAALGVDDNGNNSFFTRNVGKSSIKGVDVDFQVAVANNTLLRGGVQYLDAKYDSFLFNQVDLSDGPDGDPLNFLRPVTGCTATQLGEQADEDRSFDIDCSGMQALNAPKWTASFGVQQTVELGDVLLIGNVDGRYQGSREVGFNYIPAGRTPSSFTLDASLTVTEDDAGFSVTAFVQNLTNESILSLVQVGSGNVVGANYQSPRTYGLRAGYEF